MDYLYSHKLNEKAVKGSTDDVIASVNRRLFFRIDKVTDVWKEKICYNPN